MGKIPFFGPSTVVRGLWPMYTSSYRGMYEISWHWILTTVPPFQFANSSAHSMTGAWGIGNRAFLPIWVRVRYYGLNSDASPATLRGRVGWNCAKPGARLSNVSHSLKKCSFHSSLEYLGHSVDATGFTPPLTKWRQYQCHVMCWNWGHLGLVHYYGKFLHNLLTLLYPLIVAQRVSLLEFHISWVSSHPFPH